MKFSYENGFLLQRDIPGTINALKQYDDELQKYGAEIVGVSFPDTSSEWLVFSLKITEPLIISDKSSIIHTLVKKYNDKEIKDLAAKHQGVIPYEKDDIEHALNVVVKSTCCHCGSNICVNYGTDSANLFLCGYCQSFKSNDQLELVKLQSDYFKTSGLLQDRVAFYNKLYDSKLYNDLTMTDLYGTKLVLSFFNKFDPANLAKISPDFISGMWDYGGRLYYPFKVRILNPEGKFDYTRTDMVFVHADEFYVITDRPEYKKYDINSGIFKKKKFLDYLPSCNHFIIKAIFAGIELGAHDVHGEAIYTGDIIVSNSRKIYGMTTYYPYFHTKRAVYHGFGSLNSSFEGVEDWEIRRNIIIDNPHYTAKQCSDYENFYNENSDWFKQLF